MYRCTVDEITCGKTGARRAVAGREVLMLLFITIILSVTIASAATIVKADNTDNLNVGTSWVGGVVPDAGGGDLVQVTTLQSANRTANIAGTLSWLGIDFNSDQDLTLGNGGGTLTIGASGINCDDATSGDNLFLDGAIVLGADQSWATTSGMGYLYARGTLSGAGKITVTGSGTTTISAVNTATGGITMDGGTLTLSGTSAFTGGITMNAGTLTLSGVNGFSGGITMNDGTLTISSASTYTGNLTLNGGTLRPHSATALGDAASKLVINGGSLNNGNGSAVTITNNNPLDLNGSFTFSSSTSDNLNLGSGAVTLGSSPTITVNSNTLTIGGVIDDGVNSYSITKAGTATLVLSGTKTFGGGTIMDAGTLTLSGVNTFGGGVTMNAGTLTLSGTNAFSGGVTMNDGTLTISGTGTYTGDVTLNGGTLRPHIATALGNAANKLVITGGNLNNGSGSTVTITNNNPLDLNGSFTFSSSTSDNLNLGSGAVTLGGSPTITVNSNTLTIGGVIDDGANSYSIIKEGTATLVLSGANTFGGGVTVNAGTLTLSGTNAFTGGVTLTGGTLRLQNATALGNAANNLFITGGSLGNSSGATVTQTNNNPQTWNGDFTYGGAENLNIGTGAVTLGGSRTITVSSDVFTVGGVIDDGANSYSITKEGAGGTLTLSGANTFGGGIVMNAGTLTLSGTNNFTGGVTLNGGTLRLQNATALGNAANNLIINGGSLGNSSGATITLTNNNPQVWNSNFTYVGADNMNMGAGAVTLGGSRTITVNSDILTVGGVIDDGGHTYSITKLGPGTLRLNGTNTYTGVVTITAGTLGSAFVADAGTACGLGVPGAASDLVINGGTFSFVGASAQSTNRLFTVTENGGAINASGTAAGNIVTWSNTGDVVWSGAGARTLTFTGTCTGINVFAPRITNNGGDVISVAKSAAGRWAFTNANTFTGGVTISDGTLCINNASAIGTGTLTVSASAAIDNTTGAPITLSTNNPVALNANLTFAGTIAGGDLNLGTGTLTLSAARTITSSTAAQTLTIGGVISDGGSGYRLTKAGNGRVTLTADNATYAAGVTISDGILNIGSATALGTGTLVLVSNTGTIDNTTGAPLTLSTNNPVTLGANLTFAGTENLNIGTGAVTISGGNRTITSSTAGKALAIPGNIGDEGNVYRLTKAGAGLLTLSGANTHTGGTSLSAGTLNINSPAALGTGTFTIGAAASIDNTSGAPVTNANDNLITWSNTITFVGTNNLHLGTGAVTMTGNNRIISVTAGTVTLGGNIGDGGNNYRLSKQGTGTLVLSGTNTHTGGTSLSAGTLNINNPAAIGTGTFTVSGGTIDNTSAGDITLSNNNTQSWGGDFTYTGGTRSLNMGTGAVTLTAGRQVTVSGNTLTVGGAVSGAFALTKAGSGTLTLSGSNTYSGGTTVSAGTLLVTSGSGSGTGSGAVTVGSAATLGGSGAGRVTGAITVNGGGTVAPGTGGATIGTLNTGTLTFSATSTYSVDLDGATPNAEQINSNAGTVTCAGTLTVASIANTAFDKAYVIVSAASVTGTFAGLPNNGSFQQQGRIFQIVYTGTTVTITDKEVITPTWTATSLGSVNGGSMTLTTLFIGTGSGSTGAIRSMDLSVGGTVGAPVWSYSTNPDPCRMPTYMWDGANYKIVATAGNNLVGVRDNGAGYTALWSPEPLGGTPGNPYVCPDDASLWVIAGTTMTRRNLTDPPTATLTLTCTNASVGADMVVMNDDVYVAATNGVVTKFDYDGTPEAIWTAPNRGAGVPGIYQPLLAAVDGDARLYVFPKDEMAYVVNTSTMTTMTTSGTWTYGARDTNCGPAFMSFEGATRSGVLYCAAGKKIYKLTEGTGTATWTYAIPGDSCKSGPVMYNGKVYFGTKDSSYYAITDGGGSAAIVSKWPYPASSGNASSGPWIDVNSSRLYFGTTGGRVDAFPLQ